MKAVVIAGTKSGCGKTTVALGVMAALTRRGLRVAPFKVGPDFIDSGHHARITGTTSRNLDGWMLSNDYNVECFNHWAATADVAVVEGVMGLYDGYDGRSEAGSTAQMAKWLGLPVILTVDAKSMARSAAALVSGFENFDTDLTFAGLVFNRVGSRRHFQYLKEALTQGVQMQCLGGIEYNADLVIPERHLGLVTQDDHRLTEATIRTLAETIEDNIDVSQLLLNLPKIHLPKTKQPLCVADGKKKVRIGVARDNAFCFYYQDNLELFEQQGAELVFFSPISANQLPHPIDGLYFGGGYPELYAASLEKNVALRNEIKDSSQHGMPIYGECGGFMFLCEELWDQNGRRHAMVGCFPFSSQMFPHLTALGYREVTLKTDTIIGAAGQCIRGHEFHYSGLNRVSPAVKTVYAIADRQGAGKHPDGYAVNQTLGSYVHLHFGSQPQAAADFIKSCTRYRNQREGKP